MWGRQVLNKGIRWRIGNGKNVLVYKDNWLPRLDTFKPISSRTLLEDTAVADLMTIENQWDEDKLNQHFVYEDIEMILKIPIPQENSQDNVLWHFDKRGEYSVKNGYQLALKGRFAEASSSTTNSSN